MKKYQYLMLTILVLLLTACSTNNDKLPEPKKYYGFGHENSIHKEKKWAYKKYITISVSKKEKLKVQALIEKAFLFLNKTYGKPLHLHKVHVVVKEKMTNYPKTFWKGKWHNKREVVLNMFYIYPSELPVIVHELFHALYQSNDVIQRYPEFILEGMAVYTENYYKYKNNIKTRIKLSKIIKRENMCSSFHNFSFDSSFSRQSSIVKYRMYILGGSFFAHQKTDGRKLILKLIHNKDWKSNQKMKVKEFMQRFNLNYFPCGLVKIKQKTIENIIESEVDEYIREKNTKITKNISDNNIVLK